MSFNDNLVRLRKSANLSQEQLAYKLNVTCKAVSEWESGESMPEADKILILSDIFNVTTDKLLKGSDDNELTTNKFDLFPLLSYIFLILLSIEGYIGLFVLKINLLSASYIFLLMLVIPVIIFIIIAICRLKSKK